MNKISIDRNTLALIYNKNKDYIVPLVTIFISFILFMNITIPWLSNLSAKRQELKFEKDKLAILQENLKILTSLNSPTLDLQLSQVQDALPSSKNFAGVLNAISISANKSGVSLGDFEFQVGDLANNAVPSKGFPSLQLTLNLNGSVPSTAKFINELYKTMPISEVSSIQVTGVRAFLNTLFYYKPFIQKSIEENIPLKTLSSNDLDVLKEISSWNNPRIFEQIQPVISPAPASSPSAL